jgi:hypothetical protein
VSEREVEDGRVRIRVKEKSKKIITGVSSSTKKAFGVGEQKKERATNVDT